MEINKIYYGSCLTGMPNISDKSVNLILTDLPYEITQNKWDIKIPFIPMWKQFERIITYNGAIILTAAEPFTSLLVCSNLSMFKDKLVWVKNKATGHLNAKKMPLNAHEDILIFYKNTPVYNPQMSYRHKPMNYAVTKHTSTVYGASKSVVNNAGTRERYPQDVLYFDVVNNDDPERIHDNQKPVPLFEYLIKTYSNEGDTVLDASIGSGTTAIACINTNRNYIGFENDLTNFNNCQRRIKRYVKQPEFF